MVAASVAILVAAGAAVVRVSLEGQRLLDSSFSDVPRFPDAVAVYKRHDSAVIAESYVTPHGADEVSSYYDTQLIQRGWTRSGSTWTQDGLVFQCYGARSGA